MKMKEVVDDTIQVLHFRRDKYIVKLDGNDKSGSELDRENCT